MTERIQKILAGRGLASRRQAEEMILAGRVTCNGEISTLGQKADPDTDVITVDGVPLPQKPQYLYLMLHKPRGFVTTLSDEKGRRNVSQLVADCGSRVYPIGRLDMDSEGLLLFTNDGDFANRLMHPSHEVNKTYLVWVKGYTPESFEKLKQPVELDGYRIRPPKVQTMKVTESYALLEITIHEGRNRQVRRMCDLAGMEVTRLKRVAEGNVELGALPLGKWRHLTKEEISRLEAL